MHEVSICQSIIRMVDNEFPQQLHAIREIHLKVGLLSCVQPEFLQRVFALMTVDTQLQHAGLQFERVDITAHCEQCQKPFKVKEHVFVCPVCGEPSSAILEGNELVIDKIIIEELQYEETNQ